MNPATRTFTLTPRTDDGSVPITELLAAIDQIKRSYHRDALVVAEGPWLRITPHADHLTLTYTYDKDAQP